MFFASILPFRIFHFYQTPVQSFCLPLSVINSFNHHQRMLGDLIDITLAAVEDDYENLVDAVTFADVGIEESVDNRPVLCNN